MKVINADGRTLGRMCSEAVEKAMKGEEVKIINSEKALVKGEKRKTVERYRTRFNLKDKGNPEKSPKITSRRPDLFIKKTIKGMIPKGKEKGKKAQKRIKTYINNPENLSSEANKADKNHSNTPYTTVGEICKQIGWSGTND